MSQRGIRKVLVQGNQEDVTPYFQSTKGYGIFWDNYSATTYDDTKDETSFSSEVGDCIDYYFMYGGSANGVIAQTRSLTDDVPMMPLWYYGFLQSRKRYKNQHETMEVVRRYREERIPLDYIIQDWQYWGNNAMAQMSGQAMYNLHGTFCDDRYPPVLTSLSPACLIGIPT